MGLPLNKRVVTFGAVNSTSDSRKGYAELANALEIIDDSDITLVIFGSSVSSLPKEIESKYDVRCLGYLTDDLTLRIVYSAADVMVVPSREENLSNTIIESLACNTPVVAFDIGGNSDIINHKFNGYLANYNIKGNTLAEGISYCLGNLTSLNLNARDSVFSKYDTSVVIHKYINMYNSLILKGN